MNFLRLLASLKLKLPQLVTQLVTFVFVWQGRNAGYVPGQLILVGHEFMQTVWL